MKTKRHRRQWLRFDRLLSQNMLKQFAILMVGLAVALALSYLLLAFSGCDWQEFCEDHDISMWLLPLYLLIDSNALNNLYVADPEQVANHTSHAVHGWMLIASTLIFLVGAFVFNGIIIGIITNSIDRRVKRHQDGMIHYLKSGHYIIMGYDEMVPSVINHIFSKDAQAYVLILSAKDATAIREELSKSFCKAYMKRIIVNYGHRTSTEDYADIHLEAAEQVYIIGNSHNPAHDAINVECMDSIYRYLNSPGIKERPNRITCVFKDLDTYAAFKTSDIFSQIGQLGIEFVPYNFCAGWAKQVFVKRRYHDMEDPDKEYAYPAVYGNGIKPDDDKYVHLVFVGTTNFAVAFAMEAANVLHFPNFNRNASLKTRITFIDINADKEKDEFITRNHHLFEVQSYHYRDLSETGTGEDMVVPPSQFTGKEADFLDVEFEFIKGNVFSRKIQHLIKEWAEDANRQYLSIFLAQADQRHNFVIGMNLPDSVYDNGINVFIRQDRSDNFVTNLRNTDDSGMSPYSIVTNGHLVTTQRKGRYAHIYPFGMNETGYSEDSHSLKRAKLINYLYCTANYDTLQFLPMAQLDATPADQIWADANKLWRKLTVANKWSNLYNAYNIRTKLASLRAMRGLSVDDCSRDYEALKAYEVEELAIVEHNRWNVEKLLMGFRKPHIEEDKYAHPAFADVLAQNKKLFIHHDIRPYDELNIINMLDKEFTRYMPWIMKMTENNDK